MIRHAFNDPHWGQFVVFRPTPIAGDIWGELAPAKGTPWEKLIPVIPGELLSHALYGRTMDLIERLGNDPRKLGQKLPPLAKICVDAKSCVMYDSKRCWPTAKMPDCYRAPILPEILSQIALRWREGHYVAVFTEGEFTL